MDVPASLLDRRIKGGKTVSQVLAERWVLAALRGDRHAIRDLMQRVEGPVPIEIEANVSSDGPTDQIRTRFASILVSLGIDERTDPGPAVSPQISGPGGSGSDCEPGAMEASEALAAPESEADRRDEGADETASRVHASSSRKKRARE